MRAGWLVSLIAHIGVIMMTMLAWEVRSSIVPAAGAVVPVEIVDVAVESNVRALAEAVPEDQQETAADQTVEPQQASIPNPAARNRPQAEDWDPSQAARMLNTDQQPGRRRQEGERADRNQQGAGLGTAASVALADRVNAVGKAHLRRCWRMPIDLPEPERLVITVEFDLNRNGTLSGQPRVVSPRNYTFDPYMRVAAEAALRAIRQCDPFPFADDPVLGEHYDIWREPHVVFDPSNF